MAQGRNDPAYPLERLTYMIEDSKVKVLLTQKHLAGSLPSGDAAVVLLDEPSTFDGLSTDAPDSGADSQSLAYVIYTSGSTGAPKGVMIEHRALTNRLDAMVQEPGLTAADCMLAITTVSFDMAVT